MISLSTSGESHGRGIIAHLTGIPAGLKIDLDFINHEFARRQTGYGRGDRMKIERDQADILTGVMHGKTTGAPVTIAVWNKDWENWKNRVSEPILTPRPGHADLSGAYKYGLQDDLRQVLERSSARETTARVAGGSLVKLLLKELGIEIFSHVIDFCGIPADLRSLPLDQIREKAESSDIRMACSPGITERIKARIDLAIQEGDTLGGTIEVIALHVPPLLGSYQTSVQRLESRIASAVMSVQAVKGIEFGLGFGFSKTPGKEAHDEIYYDPNKKQYFRKTNRAGGIEGGMTTGEPIVFRAVMKPIPTLMSPLNTVNIQTKEPSPAVKERSDVTAVPACGVVLENVAAIEIANALMERYGSDTVEMLKRHVDNDADIREFRC